MGAQSLQRRHHFLLIHLYCVRDHTRGLFEAEASIVVSAAHTLENVKIFFFVGHGNLSKHQGSVLENPTFCVVIDSVTACGLPSGSITTRTRAKMRHGSPDQMTRKITNAFSVISPGGSSHRTEFSNWVSCPGFRSYAGSKLISPALNCPCGWRTVTILKGCDPEFFTAQAIAQ